MVIFDHESNKRLAALDCLRETSPNEPHSDDLKVNINKSNRVRCDQPGGLEAAELQACRGSPWRMMLEEHVQGCRDARISRLPRNGNVIQDNTPPKGHRRTTGDPTNNLPTNDLTNLPKSMTKYIENQHKSLPTLLRWQGTTTTERLSQRGSTKSPENSPRRQHGPLVYSNNITLDKLGFANLIRLFSKRNVCRISATEGPIRGSDLYRGKTQFL